MADTRVEFAGRLRTLNRKHRAMAKGYTTKMRKDGLIVARPARRRSRRGFPVMGLMMVIAGFIGFKGFLLATMGPVVYDDRITKLSDGTAVEQIGAIIMQTDPLSLYVANLIQNGLPKG